MVSLKKNPLSISTQITSESSHTSLSDSKFHIVTVLSNDPLANRLPSQLHATEWTWGWTDALQRIT